MKFTKLHTPLSRVSVQVAAGRHQGDQPGDVHEAGRVQEDHRGQDRHDQSARGKGQLISDTQQLSSFLADFG